VNISNLSFRQLEDLRKKNNPNNEPVGHFTGRCGDCHSKNLWDDGASCSYGCNDCGKAWW